MVGLVKSGTTSVLADGTQNWDDGAFFFAGVPVLATKDAANVGLVYPLQG